MLALLPQPRHIRQLRIAHVRRHATTAVQAGQRPLLFWYLETAYSLMRHCYRYGLQR